MVVLPFIVGAAIAALLVAQLLRQSRRAEFIRSFALPKGLYDKLRKRRDGLSDKDCQLAGQALRQFFLAYLKSGRKPVSMPSQVTDDLWHEFILYTRNYQRFCQQAFGHFMHHTPAVALGNVKTSNAGLRRCWWHCCRAENINPRSPTRLPLLFAIDAKLNIADGFRYAPDCGPLKRQGGDGNQGATVIHCGGDFSDASVDGSTDGFGDGGGSGDGDGGGGSDGCGGGCGGGE
jgi:hypothetical protein